MIEGKLTSPSVVSEILTRHGLRPRKRFGQNFLIDANILGKIISAADVKPDDTVLEVGPGIGALTRGLASESGRVIAVEIDRDLYGVLQETVSDCSNVQLILGDILRVDLADILRGVGEFKVVANLPYYISTPVLTSIMRSGLPWERLVVMVQAEVGARLTAPPGGKEYGLMTVVAQFYSDPEIVTKVPAGAFLPAPEVGSAVVRLTRRASLPQVADVDSFFAIVRAAFGQRRKTLANALAGGGYRKEDIGAAFATAGLDSGRRAETLSVEEFVALANAFQIGKMASAPNVV